MKRIRSLFILSLFTLAACAQTSNRPPDIRDNERWIEVDIPVQMVRLHDGTQVIGEYTASTGVNVSPETTTYTGLYKVQQMIKGPIESAPGVYVKDVIIFDIAHGNGIHSMPMDKANHILDETLGKPATAGCVRVGESATVFAFAVLDMHVWVH